MSKKILDKSASVVALDSSGAARQLLTESIRGLGFENVQGIGAMKDVIALLETDETVDWIVTPLFADGGTENALTLLKLVTVIPHLKHIRVSLLLEEEESYAINTAFDLGAISIHAKPFNKDSLGQEWERFIKTVEESDGESALIASSYIRSHLKATEQFGQLLMLEKATLEVFPATGKRLLNLAEAQFLESDLPAGKATLRQAKIVDPETEDPGKKLAEQFLPDGVSIDDPEEGEESINILGIDTVVLVDPDSTVQGAIEEIFKEFGVPNVHVFNDGDEGAQFIADNPNPGLVIHEWRIPKIPGPIFLQKILENGAPAAPIILLSSLIGEEDLPLIREMGVANLVEKPLDKAEFIEKVIWTIQQERSPTDQATMERKIFSLLKRKETDEAQELMAQFLVSDMPEARKKMVEASWALYNHDYQQCRDDCIASIKLGGESINILNLLGKSLMLLRDFPTALKCLQKAWDLSPNNIERLCAMAEVQCELGNDGAATAVLETAKDMDPDSEKIVETEGKIALSQGDTEKAREIMSKLDSLANLIGFMNNKAVAFARSGEPHSGIEQYRNAIKSIPEGETEIRSLVFYNLALAYIRLGELEEAKLQLENAINNPSPKIEAKAKSLMARISKSLADGSDFKLKSADKKEEKKAEDDDTPRVSVNLDLVRELQARRGEIGCYLMFQNDEPEPKCEDLLKELPRFKERESIQREESFGTEKSKAS